MSSVLETLSQCASIFQGKGTLDLRKTGRKSKVHSFDKVDFCLVAISRPCDGQLRFVMTFRGPGDGAFRRSHDRSSVDSNLLLLCQRAFLDSTEDEDDKKAGADEVLFASVKTTASRHQDLRLPFDLGLQRVVGSFWILPP
jgi:hypothetical protein